MGATHFKPEFRSSQYRKANCPTNIQQSATGQQWRISKKYFPCSLCHAVNFGGHRRVVCKFCNFRGNIYSGFCDSWYLAGSSCIRVGESYAWRVPEATRGNYSSIYGIQKCSGAKNRLDHLNALLIAAFSTVVWLRYVVISDQLGLSSNATPGTFGEPSSSLIWSRLGPTVVLNILIWGLGTLYSRASNEKVPGLREAYRDLQRAQRKLTGVQRPFEAAERRIKAAYGRKRQQNQVATNEYNHFLSEIQSVADRLKQG
jgi:hypothetical protein